MKNFQGWDQKKVEQLKSEGKIRDYKTQNTQQPTTGGRIVARHFQQRSKEKDWIAWNLWKWCNDHALKLEEEYKFHPERNWRFDWCIRSPKVNVALEYEGGIFNPNGDHRSVKGISRDIEKYNAASAMGWIIIRLTAINYKNLITELNKCYEP